MKLQVTDSSPTPPNRQDPQLDPADDADEPAFDWMKPNSAEKRPADSGRPAGASAAVPATPHQGQVSSGAVSSGTTTPGTVSSGTTTSGAAGQGTETQALRQVGSRADRKAAEAVEPASTGGSGRFSGPLPTSALPVRPPEDEVQRRNAEREHAANAKPVAPRVMQVLLALCFPVILLVLAVRAVASPLFLWVEYNRPGFPGDGYGFSTDDRMTYGSYAVDYLSNWAGPRYLGELVQRGGEKLFKDGEVSHMADVKVVILSAFGAGAVLLLLSLIAVVYLRRRSRGGVRRGLFAGALIALVIILSLGVLGVLGWEQFFTQFHSVFFASGTWTFSLQDTLIRLFPAQFWVDGGIVIAGLVLIVSLLTLILTWPTRKRRGLPKRGAAPQDPAGEETAAAASTGSAADGAAPAKRSLFRRSKADAPAGLSPAASEGPATDSAAGPANAPETTTTGTAATGSRDTPTRGQSSSV
ncbi:integral membrane protein (TIGR01906 family) [Arthrobacter sp. MP_M7]|nr:integral membrane protein (TIGR01906 family) [Arthrobacter sp. MP_M4]MEC5202728.1 integral membrane protein (TIGR01906 family) [Arthrobacter sp. MP_M7]